MRREKREMGNEKLKMRDEMWEIGNQEFWSWTWNGIELGPKKWEMGFKWEFSWLKCYPLGTFFVNFFSRFMFVSHFTFGISEMGKESHTSCGNCDFNGDKLVGKGKREITFFKIKKFLGNVIWEKEFVKRNLRKMCPRGLPLPLSLLPDFPPIT